MYFRLTSSFNTWATWSEEIFSRADRSWILWGSKENRISVRGKLHPCQGVEENNLPNHRNSNRPRRIANRETEIRIIGSLVLTLLHMVYDLCQTRQHIVRKGLKLTQE
jgi:hypothetical protein